MVCAPNSRHYKKDRLKEVSENLLLFVSDPGCIVVFDPVLHLCYVLG